MLVVQRQRGRKGGRCSRGIERERQRHKEQAIDETGHGINQIGQMKRKGGEKSEK